ncbi:MAG TPA: hypothetical protein VFZ54_16005, partial [Burkholderiales bacterium]
EELRRWEKVQFAHRYRALGQQIELARTRLTDARQREALAAARLAELENELERLRLDLTDADGATTAAREAAHAAELEIGRLQQQIAFDKHQVEQLGVAASEIAAEVQALERRREPARQELEARRDAARRAADERDTAAATLAGEEIAYADAKRQIEGLEADVEAARSEVYAAVNAATALRHAMEHAAAARTRLGEQIAKLDIEGGDLRVEAERADRDRGGAAEARDRANQAMDGLRVDRGARESELAGARAQRDELARELRTREHDLASLEARLKFIEELDAARAEYGDAARAILAEEEGFPHLGSVADYLEADKQFERAVEACLGDRLQYVVVPSHDVAAAGLRLAGERSAGRVGFVIPEGTTEDLPYGSHDAGVTGDLSLIRLRDVVRISGPAAETIGALIADAWIAPDFDTARTAAGMASARGTIATAEGHVFHGPTVVEGGVRAEARGILATKREIKELRERAGEDRTLLDRVRERIAGVDVVIAAAESAIMSLNAELHRQEKAIVGFELQHGSALEAVERITRKQGQISNERRAAEEEQRSQQARQEEARESIVRIEAEQKSADDNLNRGQRRLFEAREAMQAQAHRAAEAKAAHAALVERATALTGDVERLEQASSELEARLSGRADELRRNEARSTELQTGIASSATRLDDGVRQFDALRERVRTLDERSQELRATFEQQETQIKDARRALEAVRSEAAQLDVARATAEADLSHLAQSCADTVQATLEEVAAEVQQLEREGVLASPKAVDDAPEPAETGDDESVSDVSTTSEGEADEAMQPLRAGESRTLTPDEMVAD